MNQSNRRRNPNTKRIKLQQLKIEAAQLHADELKILLFKEEQTSEALLQSKNALEHAAFHDFLTDLPNRTYLVERLKLLIEIGIEISHQILRYCFWI